MKLRSLRPIHLAAAALAGLLLSCGGSGDGSRALDPQAQISKIASTEDVLRLPVLRSGNRWYADVQLRLADDGSFEVLGWTLRDTPGPAQAAQLEPAIPLELLGGAEASLTVQRMHIDAEVFSGVTVLISGGRWRYASAPQRASNLASADLRSNPALAARPEQLLMLTGNGSGNEEVALQVEDRTYRFCMDAEPGPGETLTVIDPAGQAVLTLDEPGECGNFDGRDGTYKLRRTSAAKAPPMFLQPPLPGAGVRTTLPGDEDDYWLIEGTLLTFDGQWSNHSAFLTGYRRDPSGCLSYIVAAARGRGEKEADGVSERKLFDTGNFFRILRDRANDRPIALGNTQLCRYAAIVGDERSFAAPLEFNDSRPTTRPIEIAAFDASTQKFTLQFPRAVQPLELGRPNDRVFFYSEFDLRPSMPGSSARYQAKYRLRMRGIGASEALERGEAALFSSTNCTGPALILKDYNLPLMDKGTAGHFSGSMRTGPATELRAYTGRDYAGNPQQVSGRECVQLPAGVQSVRVHENYADLVVSSRNCEGCNLAGLDFSGRNLEGVKLARAVLSNTNFERAALQNADLRNALLLGAQMRFTNLNAANLCGAQLNAETIGGSVGAAAADLTGAFLRNVNLARSNISGVTFSNASFFSADPVACDPGSCDAYRRPQCASATNATADGATFSDAYLAGTDFSNIRARGANFTGAVLVGASFKNARLEPLDNRATVFSNAFLQGADFSSAQLASVRLGNAYGADQPGCMQFELEKAFTSFPGFSESDAKGACKVVEAQTTCVQFNYTQRTLLPAGTTLPRPVVPLADARPRNSAECTVQPLCGDAFTGSRRNLCW